MENKTLPLAFSFLVPKIVVIPQNIVACIVRDLFSDQDY
jgi:hypothetical protein